MNEYFTGIKVLNDLIKDEGIVECIRDYYATVNNRLSIIYATEDFYIAEDNTFQPWLAVMGHLPQDMTERELRELLLPYVENEKFIAVYTNIELVSDIFSKCDILTYHEDLPYIERTYIRSGHEQLLSRMQSFIANQMIKNNMIPYVMISRDNEIAKKLQAKHGSTFAEKLFCFYAKGKYELE